jgi:hypothetical protein
VFVKVLFINCAVAAIICAVIATQAIILWHVLRGTAET